MTTCTKVFLALGPNVQEAETYIEFPVTAGWPAISNLLTHYPAYLMLHNVQKCTLAIMMHERSNAFASDETISLIQTFPTGQRNILL